MSMATIELREEINRLEQLANKLVAYSRDGEGERFKKEIKALRLRLDEIEMCEFWEEF